MIESSASSSLALLLGFQIALDSAVREVDFALHAHNFLLILNELRHLGTNRLKVA